LGVTEKNKKMDRKAEMAKSAPRDAMLVENNDDVVSDGIAWFAGLTWREQKVKKT
jgi:hypothetical protein